MSDLKSIGGDFEDAIDRVRVPAYVIDRHGIIRWLNPAARKLVGDVRGRQLTSVVAPEETRLAKEIFTRNLFGPSTGSDNKAVVIDAHGERVSVEVSASLLHDGGRVIGVFGQVRDVHKHDPSSQSHPSLTPRQAEVLRLLEYGCSTQQIARELHLSIDTVRNHIRHLLARAQRALTPRGRRGRAARASHRELTRRYVLPLPLLDKLQLNATTDLVEQYAVSDAPTRDPTVRLLTVEPAWGTQTAASATRILAGRPCPHRIARAADRVRPRQAQRRDVGPEPARREIVTRS